MLELVWVEKALHFRKHGIDNGFHAAPFVEYDSHSVDGALYIVK